MYKMKRKVFLALFVILALSAGATFAAEAPLNMADIPDGTLPYPFKVWIPPTAQNGGMTSGNYLYITVNLPTRDFQQGLASPSTEPVLRTTVSE